MVASLSVLACGCSFSKVDPNASVVVSGTALTAAGRPLANTKVLLFKQADIGGVLFGGILALGSLGTVCLLPDAPAICNKARTATTDASGRYHFDLKGEDTQGSLGTEATLNVVFSGGSSSTTVSFTAKQTAIRLPQARLVNLAPHVTQPSGRIRVSWSGLPAAAGRQASYSAQLFAAGGQSALWTQTASGRSTSLDPRLLEDRSGSVAVGASTVLTGSTGAGTVHGYYLSKKLPVRATAGAPPSRGKRCAPVTGTSPARDGVFSRCAATDGDLDNAARLSGNGVVTGAVVDLGSVRPVSLVIGRGFTGQVLVEISTNGRSFSTVATSSGTAVATEVPGSQRARYVRLRSPSGLDQSLSSELSVW
ncbi:MAG: discoidin domain-containing protein [Marmoricola sp.]